MPEIFITVGFTPTTANFGGIGGGSYDHLFILEYYAAASTQNAASPTGYVFDGGPAHTCYLVVASCGNLTAWTSINGHYNETLNPSASYFMTVPVSLSTAAALYTDAAALSQSLATTNHFPYNPISGPNSNSVVYTLLGELGIQTPIQTVVTGGYGGGFAAQTLGYLNFNGTNQYFTGWAQWVAP